MIRLLAHPPPSPHSLSLSQSSCVSPVELTDRGEGGGGRQETKADDREKAWSSINHSILSGTDLLHGDHRVLTPLPLSAAKAG